MKTMKMFATTTLLIAGILINQAFAQSARNTSTSARKSPATEMKTNQKNVPVSANQKAPEARAVNTQVQSAKPAVQTAPAGSKVLKPEATAMNRNTSVKHHRSHRERKNAGNTVNKNNSKSKIAVKPAEKPKSH